MLCLRIEDDGVGFDVQAVQHAGLSVGMRSMAARAERMGGTLEVESGAAGTVVRLEMLLKK
ncbi:Histidine kinase-, DNA gyrase B-, and HSP90-like ATPase [compost metagenome]